MRKREILQLLERVLRDARMDRANFGTMSTAHPYPTSEKDVTEFIKERTRVYRQSWIISPLEQVIALIEQDGKKTRNTAAQLTQLEGERD